jgi:hypothetical protein
MGILGKRNALEVLFTPVQRRLIGILFGRPRTRFQSADLIRQTGAGVGAVHRVLTAFAEAGLLKTSRQGNQKFYQADDAHPMYPELCAIVAKTLGLAGPIEQVLSRYQRYISVAFISGVLGKKIEDASAVIEVFVISEDVDVSAISRAFKAVASRLGGTSARSLSSRMSGAAASMRRVLLSGAPRGRRSHS